MPADVEAEVQGALTLLRGRSEKGKAWLEANVDPQAKRLGESIITDWRCGLRILQAASEAGLCTDYYRTTGPT